MPKIGEARILIIATHGVEQDELMVPREKLKQAGATVHVASPDGGTIRGWKFKDWGETIASDKKLDDVDPAEYHALVIPGGQINPDLLRVNETALRIVRAFVDAGKIVAAVCHGPWLLVEVDAVRGRNITSYKSIKTDVKNAGGQWVDKEVVVDKGIITSRQPSDLDAFVAKIVEEVQEGRHERHRAA